MIEMVSYVEDGKDVFRSLIQKLQEKNRAIHHKAILRKISGCLQLFLDHQHPDGNIIKCVKGSIYEMRILLGGTGYVARIFFHREKNRLILLTGSLIKPRIYSEKQINRDIEHTYTACIEKSQKIAEDYLTFKNYEYTFISLSVE